MNEDYLINQVNHLRSLVDEFESNRKQGNNIYSLVNETIDETFWVTDLNLIFNIVNPSIKKIIGYSEDNLLNKSLEDFLTKESVEILKNKLKEELVYIEKHPEKNPDFFERVVLSFKHKNNEMNIWCEVKIRFLLDGNLKPVSIFGTLKDITEQKLIEEAIYKKMDNNESSLLEELNITKKELDSVKKELEKVKLELSSCHAELDSAKK